MELHWILRFAMLVTLDELTGIWDSLVLIIFAVKFAFALGSMSRKVST